MPDTIDNPNDQEPVTEHLLEQGTSFRPDHYLYRVLQPGQDFLEENGFKTYSQMVEKIRANGKRVILSVGESSTSGWDTSITSENRERKAKGLLPISAFFRYKNFTDMVRDKVGDEFEVVNAGIPGHTALSGIRRLKMLHTSFARDGIAVSYVLIHYGNNDNLWEGNLQDKKHLRLHPRSPATVEKFRNWRHKRVSDRMVLRSTVDDFGVYFLQMINYARKIGAPPIIVQPEIPIYWKPGSRFVDFDMEQMAAKLGAQEALANLADAVDIWESVIEQPYSEQKIQALEKAAELDFLLPRIKRPYLQELQRVAWATQTPLIQTPVPRDEDEANYFIDYCHPRENVNKRIASMIVDHMHTYEKKTRQ